MDDIKYTTCRGANFMAFYNNDVIAIDKSFYALSSTVTEYLIQQVIYTFPKFSFMLKRLSTELIDLRNWARLDTCAPPF